MDALKNLAGNPTLSTPFQILIPHHIYDAMISQAYSELPNECCGLLAGRIEESADAQQDSVVKVDRCYPLVNSVASPTEYLSDARSMLDADKDMRRRSIDLLAVYHSHPTTAPIPSKKDLEKNDYLSVIHFIISLQGTQPEVRAWWLAEKDYREADWHLIG